MKPKFKTFFLLFLVLSLTLFGSSEGGEEHGFNWKLLFAKVLNSTLLFGLLIYFLRKPIIDLLSQRSLDINKDIVNREANIREASLKFDEMRKRLEDLEAEVEEMRAQARQSGEEEKRRLQELGSQEKEKILKVTEAEIQNRVDASIKQLKAKIADLAIAQFKKDIQKKLDKDKHRTIIEKNIERSGEIN